MGSFLTLCTVMYLSIYLGSATLLAAEPRRARPLPRASVSCALDTTTLTSLKFSWTLRTSDKKLAVRRMVVTLVRGVTVGKKTFRTRGRRGKLVVGNLTSGTLYTFKARATLSTGKTVAVRSLNVRTVSLPTLSLTPLPTPTPTPTGTTVVVPPAANFSVLTIPAGSLILRPEQHVMFQSEVTGGSAPYIYQWLLDGQPLQTTSTMGTFEGIREAVLNLSNAIKSDNGTPAPTANLQLQVTDFFGATAHSPQVSLSVLFTDFVSPNPSLSFRTEVQAQSFPNGLTLQFPLLSRPFVIKTVRRTFAGDQEQSFSDVSNGSTLTDFSVTPETLYEYIMQDTKGLRLDLSIGCLDCPPSSSRGDVLLIVENDIALGLAGELTQFRQNLLGDGWFVQSTNVARTDSALQVKSKIADWYAQSPRMNAHVVLMGAVPIAYSGDRNQINPAINPEYSGAWATDGFYADLDGVWTDVQVDNSTHRKVISNTPGDGRYDQNFLPSAPEVAVGRIDFSNLPAFAVGAETPRATELRLVGDYLHKVHDYRQTAQNPSEWRALVLDTLTEDPRHTFYASYNFGDVGYQFFPEIVTSSKIFDAQIGLSLPQVISKTFFPFIVAAGSGSNQSLERIGSAGEFAGQNLPFTLGIFFGNFIRYWAAENSFLRSSIAGSGGGLMALYSGIPKVIPYGVGVGMTLGEALKQQSIRHSNQRQVWLSYHGDPTLTLYPHPGPQVDTAYRHEDVASKIDLSWQADPRARGYVVYGVNEGENKLEPLTSVITETAVTVTTSASKLAVRSLRRETSGAGTFRVFSQATFITVP